MCFFLGGAGGFLLNWVYFNILRNFTRVLKFQPFSIILFSVCQTRTEAYIFEHTVSKANVQNYKLIDLFLPLFVPQPRRLSPPQTPKNCAPRRSVSKNLRSVSEADTDISRWIRFFLFNFSLHKSWRIYFNTKVYILDEHHLGPWVLIICRWKLLGENTRTAIYLTT